MRVRVKRVGVAQMAKIMGLLYALVSLFFMPLFLLVALVDPEGQPGGMAFALLLPALYGLLGFVVTALMAWLFNVVAGWVGGMELDLDWTPPETAGWGGGAPAEGPVPPPAG